MTTPQHNLHYVVVWVPELPIRNHLESDFPEKGYTKIHPLLKRKIRGKEGVIVLSIFSCGIQNIPIFVRFITFLQNALIIPVKRSIIFLLVSMYTYFFFTTYCKLCIFSFLGSDHQPQLLNFPAMFRSGSHNIDSRRFNTPMPQYIGQLCYVLFYIIEGSRKQLPEIVRKYLGGLHSCRLT